MGWERDGSGVGAGWERDGSGMEVGWEWGRSGMGAGWKWDGSGCGMGWIWDARGDKDTTSGAGRSRTMVGGGDDVAWCQKNAMCGWDRGGGGGVPGRLQVVCL